VIPTLFRESGVDVIFADLESTSVSDLPHIVAQISRGKPTTYVLVTPSNPYGWIASEEFLHTLCNVLQEHGGYLLVDHSFALVGAGRTTAPLLPHCIDRFSDWIFVWDTGKTFDCHGDKLGAICANDHLASDVASFVNLIQGELSLRVLGVINAYLASQHRSTYLKKCPELLGETRESSKALLERRGLAILTLGPSLP
jgi:aspartate/methionine/tyrosine aminotransferase